MNHYDRTIAALASVDRQAAATYVDIRALASGAAERGDAARSTMHVRDAEKFAATIMTDHAWTLALAELAEQVGATQ